jgi:PhnB protein
VKVEPYLSFEGRCEEALEFYKTAVGAKLEFMMRYKEAPDKPPEGMVAPGSENKIMHCSFLIGDSRIMATDGGCTGGGKFEGISLALSSKTTAETEKSFNALAQGGQLQMPLGKTFFSPSFGMLVDKFGISWMIVTEQEMQ